MWKSRAEFRKGKCLLLKISNLGFSVKKTGRSFREKRTDKVPRVFYFNSLLIGRHFGHLTVTAPICDIHSFSPPLHRGSRSNHRTRLREAGKGTRFSPLFIGARVPTIRSTSGNQRVRYQVSVPSSSGLAFQRHRGSHVRPQHSGFSPLFIGARVPTPEVRSAIREASCVSVPSSSGLAFQP